MKAVSVYDYGGGFRLGAEEAGLETVAKLELGDRIGRLCLAQVAANLYTPDLISAPPEAWPLGDLGRPDVVYGNPPCAGFSLKGAKKGVNHPSATIRWREFAAAAQVLRPRFTVLESVQRAIERPDGRALLQEVRDTVDPGAWLHHVVVTAGEVGSAQAHRERYFAVVTREPFHPSWPAPVVTTTRDVIGNGQVPSPAQDHWAAWPDNTKSQRIAAWDRAGLEPYVKPGPVASQNKDLFARFLAAGGNPSDFDQPWVLQALAEGRSTSAGWQYYRLGWDRPAPTVLKDDAWFRVHPGAPLRTLSLRESSMLMGFPPGWRIDEDMTTGTAGILTANGVTRQAGAFVLAGLGQEDGIAEDVWLVDSREVFWCSPWRVRRPWLRGIAPDRVQPGQTSLLSGRVPVVQPV